MLDYASLPSASLLMLDSCAFTWSRLSQTALASKIFSESFMHRVTCIHTCAVYSCWSSPRLGYHF